VAQQVAPGLLAGDLGLDARKAIWWPATRRSLSDRSTLTYGQSITDACIDLATTQRLLKELAEAVASCSASLAPV